MLATSRIMAFAPTTNAENARAFYGEKLGLLLLSEDPFALVFDCAGIILRVQKVERFEPHPFTALGWQVEDIEDFVTGLENRGVVFEKYPFVEDPRGIWTAPGGARIAWFKDPDGNTLSLTQFPQN
jgi:catechol 2,3-dioxygenase-like lactoylglutathione lyase family enzyme